MTSTKHGYESSPRERAEGAFLKLADALLKKVDAWLPANDQDAAVGPPAELSRTSPWKAQGSPLESALGYFKAESYRLILTLMSGPYGKRIIRDILRDHGTDIDTSFSENAFWWGLRAIDPAYGYLTKQDLYRYSLEMLYASRHKVPPEFLIGFIYQSGASRMLAKKVNEGLVETTFEDLRRAFSDQEIVWPAKVERTSRRLKRKSKTETRS